MTAIPKKYAVYGVHNGRLRDVIIYCYTVNECVCRTAIPVMQSATFIVGCNVVIA